MTLKAKCYAAMLVIVVVLVLLPTSIANSLYYEVNYQSAALNVFATWILPIVVAVACFALLKDVIKAAIAGAVSWGGNLLIVGVVGLSLLDCGADVAPDYGLSQACSNGVLLTFKLGIAAMLCFNLFLIYRIAAPKPPKTQNPKNNK